MQGMLLTLAVLAFSAVWLSDCFFHIWGTLGVCLSCLAGQFLHLQYVHVQTSPWRQIWWRSSLSSLVISIWYWSRLRLRLGLIARWCCRACWTLTSQVRYSPPWRRNWLQQWNWSNPWWWQRSIPRWGNWSVSWWWDWGGPRGWHWSVPWRGISSGCHWSRASHRCIQEAWGAGSKA